MKKAREHVFKDPMILWIKKISISILKTLTSKIFFLKIKKIVFAVSHEGVVKT